MQDSHLCDGIVRFLDATVRELNPAEQHENIVKALGSFVKNHKVNPQNIFEIIEILWPESEMYESDLTGDGAGDFSSYISEKRQQDSLIVYHVIFPDKSSGYVVSTRGLSLDFVVVS